MVHLEERTRDVEQQRSEAAKKHASEKHELLRVNKDMARDLKAAVKANEELHQFQKGDESREANTEGKLHLEKERREGVESQLAEVRSYVAAFEPDEVAV